LPFDLILGSQFSGNAISASLIDIDSEITNGYNDNDLNCEKKYDHVNQYQVSKTKTKVIAVSLDEKNNSVVEKSYVEGCATTATATATATTPTAIATPTSKCDLYLEHAVCRDDVADEEEGMEILGDLHSLCEVFGVISDVWIQENKEKKKEVMRFHPNLLSGSVPLEDPWTFIEFDSTVCASQAVSALNGRHIGGEVLEASLYNYDAYRCAIYDSRYCVRAVKEQIGSIGTVEGVLQSVTCDCECEGAVVVLRNYVTAEDLEECEGLGEELAAIKRDLLLLCTAQPLHSNSDCDVPVEASVRRVSILSSYDLNHGQSVAGGGTADLHSANGCISVTNNSDNCHDNDDDGNNENRNDSNISSSRNSKNNSHSDGNSDRNSDLVACVRFNSVAAATDAMLSLDGTLLSGNRLRASIRRLTPQTLFLPLTGPATLLHVNYPDITPTRPSTSTTTTTSTLPSNSNSVANNKLAIELNTSNTRPVDSVHEDRGPGIHKAKAASGCEMIENVKVQDPKISVYTEAVLAPKLKKNTATDGMIKVTL
jgi:hypothetical protein